MVDSGAVSQLDQQVVRDTLESLRQAEPLGYTPLRQLLWIHRQIEKHNTAPALEYEITIQRVLTELIVGQYAKLRQVENLPEPLEDCDRNACFKQLHADFSCTNSELEAWSLLYYRYQRLELDLQIQSIATELNISDRQVRRRMARGYRRLLEIISQYEAVEQRAHRKLWQRLKLPAAHYSRLFGVDTLLAELERVLLNEQSAAGVLLYGGGGAGKTAAAHQLTLRLIETEHFDEIIWLTLDYPTTLENLLMSLAAKTGFQQFAAMSTADLLQMLRLRLVEYTPLIVLDAAEYLEQPAVALQHLIKLASPGKLLITSRVNFADENLLSPMLVESLSRPDFDRFVEHYRRLKRLPVSVASPDEKAKLYRASGGNPFVTKLLMGRAGVLPPDRTAGDLAEIKLDDGTALLDHLFTPIWLAFSEQAKQAAVAMTLLMPETIYYAEIATVAALVPEELDQALLDLAKHVFIEVSQPGPVYSLPPLTRQFVEQYTRQEPYRNQYYDMLQRWIESGVGGGSGLPIEQRIRPLHMLDEQVERGFVEDRLVDLVLQMAPIARRSGRWLLWRDMLRHVIAALESSGRESRLDELLHELGVAQRQLGDFAAAARTLQEAVAGSGMQGAFARQAETLIELGDLYSLTARQDMALIAYQRAAASGQQYEVYHVRKRALLGLANLLIKRSQHKDAYDILLQALNMTEAEESDGRLLSLLGMTLLQAGDTEQSVYYQLEAIDYFQEDGDLPREARALHRLGMAYQQDRRYEQALHAYQAALELMRATGDLPGEARLLTNCGALYAERGELEAALNFYREALNLQRATGDQVGMAHTWYNLADLYWKMAQVEQATHCMTKAEALAFQLDLTALLAQIKAHPHFAT